MKSSHRDRNIAVYDLVGIGLGPFNLGLAALCSNIPELDALFLDQRTGFNWHPGLMIEGVHLQTPFLSDLVTLADPTHPLSFLNYIKQQGRIYSFYIRENFFLLRQEYNQYCQWAASRLQSLRWDSQVTLVEYDVTESHYRVFIKDTNKLSEKIIRTKKLVIGTGPTPFIPQCCQSSCQSNHNVIHSSDYQNNKDALQNNKRITVVGSGQSAAEIFYDLLQSIDISSYGLDWISASPRFFPLEYTKLTLEMTSPEYVDYFYKLPAAQRRTLIDAQKGLYKGINTDLINSIFDLLYVKRLVLEEQSRALDVQLLTNSRLIDMEERNNKLTLSFKHSEQNQTFSHTTESVILATGYHNRPHEFLKPIQNRLCFDDNGNYQAHRNYSIDHRGEDIFVQNSELLTHGFVTPDLGMACYRNASILREITGVEHYLIESNVAFQNFGVPNFSSRSVRDTELNPANIERSSDTQTAKTEG